MGKLSCWIHLPHPLQCSVAFHCLCLGTATCGKTPALHSCCSISGCADGHSGSSNSFWWAWEEIAHSAGLGSRWWHQSNVERCASPPLSSALHPAMGSTASGCCFSCVGKDTCGLLPVQHGFPSIKGKPHTLKVPCADQFPSSPSGHLLCQLLLSCQPWSGQSYRNSLIVSSTGCSEASLVTSNLPLNTPNCDLHISKESILQRAL